MLPTKGGGTKKSWPAQSGRPLAPPARMSHKFGKLLYHSSP